MNVKILPSQHQEIIQRYINGESTTKICKDYNVKDGAISRILKSNGIIPHGRKPRKYYFNENFFESIDSESKAYFLGLLYADGYNRYDKLFSVVSLSLQENDIDILLKIIKEISYTGKLKLLKSRNIKHKNQIRLNLFSRKFSNDAFKHGLLRKKSLILKFPTEDQVPNHLIRHFIRGYFDGDGCICYTSDNKAIVTFTGSKDFCNSLLSLINKQFIDFAYIQNYKNPSTKGIRIGTRKALVFLDWLYDNSNIYLNRKYDKFIETLKKYKCKKYSKIKFSSEIDLLPIFKKYIL